MNPEKVNVTWAGEKTRPKGNATENVAKIEKRNFDFAVGGQLCSYMCVGVQLCVCASVWFLVRANFSIQAAAQAKLLIELNFLAAK